MRTITQIAHDTIVYLTQLKSGLRAMSVQEMLAFGCCLSVPFEELGSAAVMADKHRLDPKVDAMLRMLRVPTALCNFFDALEHANIFIAAVRKDGVIFVKVPQRLSFGD